MKFPPYLRKDDKIALIAPSFGCAPDYYGVRLDESIRRFKKEGFSVIEGPNVRLVEGVCSSAPAKKRAEEFMDAYLGEGDLILSVGGGELMCEMLPYVDFGVIGSAPPKWFMGFSDNTNLTFTLTTLTDLVTVYGPCAPAFFQKKWRLCERDAIDMLMGRKHFEGYPKYSITRRNADHPLYAYRLTQRKIITPYGYAPMEGTFLGGCLDILSLLCGTKFDGAREFVSRHPEGIIWYLEACDLNALGLRTALFKLVEAGWFDNAKGFLLGRMLSAREEIMGVDRFKSAIDMLSPFGVPILMDIDLGHISPSMPFLNGASGRVELKEGNIIIDYD